MWRRRGGAVPAGDDSDESGGHHGYARRRKGCEGEGDKTRGEGDEPRLRVTSVIWVEARNRFEVRWSCSMDPVPLPAYTTATLQLVADRIPETADGGTQIIVESEYDFTPLFDNGIEAMTFREFVPVRPRFEAVTFTDPQNCN